MPRTPRKPEEIEAFRDEIMNRALDLIVRDGYNGFSMRKLASPLGITAKTIYNYFKNKDDIYLRLLTKGFEQLYTNFESATADCKDPLKRLAAAIRAYVHFGLENSNMYNLMFTWHVPKFNDYVGTPMEKLAQQELTTALRCADLFRDLIRSCVESSPPPDEDTISCELIQIWVQMHGYVAGINNTLLDYLHESPISLKEHVISRIINNAKRNIMHLP